MRISQRHPNTDLARGDCPPLTDYHRNTVFGTRAESMANILANHIGPPRGQQRGEVAGVRVIVLAVVCLLVVAAVGAGWFYYAAHRGPAVGGEATGQPPVALSDATLAALQKLDSVLEIRFYSVLELTGSHAMSFPSVCPIHSPVSTPA